MKSPRKAGAIMKANQGKKFHEIVEGVLEQGSVGMLAGPAKGKKSMLALNLALSLLTGRPFLGKKTQGPKVGKGDELGRHTALYLDLELTDMAITNRLTAMAQNYGPGCAERLFYITRQDLEDDEQTIMDAITKKPNKKFFEALKRQVIETGASVLLVDCLYVIVSEENDNSLMTGALLEFQKIRNETGATIVIIHHTRKDKPDFREPFQVGRGASSIGGFMEWVLAIEPKSFGSLDATLHHGSRNMAGVPPFPIKFDEASLVWRGEAEKTPDAILEQVIGTNTLMLAEDFYQAMKERGISFKHSTKLVSTSERFERRKSCPGRPSAIVRKMSALDRAYS